MSDYETAIRVLQTLPQHLADTRTKHNIGVTQAAREIGIATPTIYRIEQGRPLGGDGICLNTAIRVLQWLHTKGE